MAYQKDWRDEEEAGAAPGTVKQNTSGVVNGQTSADAATSSAPAPAPTPSAQGTGSGFVNLQSYMDANKGEGGRMINDATSGLTGDAAKFKDTAAQTVADQTKAMQGATGSDKLPALQKGLAADPTANAPAARDFVNSTAYAGPTADTADAGLAAQQADLASKLGSVTADSALGSLKDKVNTPYTTGFGYLDKFLTGDQSGQDALASVHAKAGDVDAAGAAARAQLGTSEAAARAKLAANQQAVKDTAGLRRGEILGNAIGKTAILNGGLDRKNYFGVVDHNLSAGLSDKDRSDLEALNAITGGAKDPSWYASSDPYSAGQKVETDTGSVPIPAPAPEAKDPSLISKLGGGLIPKLISQAPEKVDNFQKFETNKVNDAQTKVADQIGDPVTSKITEGVNNLNTGLANNLPIVPETPNVNVPNLRPRRPKFA